MMEAPSWTHLLGTDQFGRDLLSRIIFGARTAMIVGLSSALIGGVVGLVLGVGSAYFGGKTDLLLQRVFDVLMAFPLIIMALAVVAIFGTGVQNVIVAITIPLIPRCARVVRSSALAIRDVPYVDAARALGFGHVRIILCHMVPNVMAPFLIMVTAFVGQAILAEASLSYLGLGVQEPVPAWGLMLQGGSEEFATTAPWIAIFPGVAIMLVCAWDQLVRRCLARYAGTPKLSKSRTITLASLGRGGEPMSPTLLATQRVAPDGDGFASVRTLAQERPVQLWRASRLQERKCCCCGVAHGFGKCKGRPSSCRDTRTK